MSGSVCPAGLCSVSDMQKELGSDMLNEYVNEGMTSPWKTWALGNKMGKKVPGSPGTEVRCSEQQSWLGP